MRNLEEIDMEINKIDVKIRTLKEQRLILMDERSKREFADFCEAFGVKKGDVVHIGQYGNVMIDGVDKAWLGWIAIRKIKKNGEPYKSVEHHLPRFFDGCKVIRHIKNN